MKVTGGCGQPSQFSTVSPPADFGSYIWKSLPALPAEAHPLAALISSSVVVLLTKSNVLLLDAPPQLCIFNCVLAGRGAGTSSCEAGGFGLLHLPQMAIVLSWILSAPHQILWMPCFFTSHLLLLRCRHVNPPAWMSSRPTAPRSLMTAASCLSCCWIIEHKGNCKH